MARGGAAQACARVVPRLVADVVVRERAQWCTLTSQFVFRSQSASGLACFSGVPPLWERVIISGGVNQRTGRRWPKVRACAPPAGRWVGRGPRGLVSNIVSRPRVVGGRHGQTNVFERQRPLKLTGYRGAISEGRLCYSDTIAHSSNFRTHPRRSGGNRPAQSDTGATSSDLPAANQHATHSTRGPHARPIWSLGPGRERGKHFCRPSGPSGGQS